MPWHIEKGGGTCKASEWAVIKDSDGSTAGCHSSEQKAKDQLAALYANESVNMSDNHEQVYSHLARVQLVTPRYYDKRRELHGVESSEDFYYFDAEISNDLLDAHYTHMSEKTLSNYAEDANRGVAFLRGHNWRELPLGYSISAELIAQSGRKSVLAGFYTVRGIVETDDLIKRMEAKILRDVSVGFHGGRMVCDLCGQDFWDCRHFPGLKYETKEGDVVKTELATFTIDDARLSEVSGVFDGSTPEAMIRKAQVFAERGKLTRIETDVLMQQYRIKLPAKYRTVYDMGNIGPIPIERREERTMDEKDFVRIKTVLVRTKTVNQEQADTLDDTTVASALEQLGERFTVLEAQAEEGRQYRSDLISTALAEGVRAHGNDFDKDGYRIILESSSLSAIKRMTADWKKIADATLPSGRQSQDTTESRKSTVVLVPDEAYA
jgi:hypothetical protein